MNAITRESFISSSFVDKMTFSFELSWFRIAVLFLFLLGSALGMVYVKDLNRRLSITYHRLQEQIDQLQATNRKLLLERSAWGAQQRVQMVAQKRLQMQIPAAIDIVMVKV